MSASDVPNSPKEIGWALFDYFGRGSSEAALVTMVFRLMIEVEALREALSTPETPESVRQSYREAYERIALESHNAAGPDPGVVKVLSRFFPHRTDSERFASEMAMLDRLGASHADKQAIRVKLEFDEQLD
jgi:hypothetical protein